MDNFLYSNIAGQNVALLRAVTSGSIIMDNQVSALYESGTRSLDPCQKVYMEVRCLEKSEQMKSSKH